MMHDAWGMDAQDGGAGVERTDDAGLGDRHRLLLHRLWAMFQGVFGGNKGRKVCETPVGRRGGGGYVRRRQPAAIVSHHLCVCVCVCVCACVCFFKVSIHISHH